MTVTRREVVDDCRRCADMGCSYNEKCPECDLIAVTNKGHAIRVGCSRDGYKIIDMTIELKTRDQAIELAREAMNRTIKGVAMHHKEFNDGGSFVFKILSDALTALDKLLGDKK